MAYATYNGLMGQDEFGNGGFPSWIGANGGLNNFQIQDGPPSQYANNQRYGMNPTTGQWEPLFQDQSGNLWLASDPGKPAGAKAYEFTSPSHSLIYDTLLPPAVAALTGVATGGLAAGAGAGAASSGGLMGLDAGGAATGAAGGTASAGAAGGAAAAGGEGATAAAGAAGAGGGMDLTDLFGPSVLPGGGDFGTLGGSGLFTDTTGGAAIAGDTAAEFPWLSNAPAGSPLAFGGSPAADFASSSGFDLSSLSMPDLSSLSKLLPLLNGGAGSGSLFGITPQQAGSIAPGLLALAYASKQPGIDTSNLSGILGKLGGNQDAVVKAATDPLQQNIAAGYGDLLQSQSLRGIRGSSFGDTDIANYLSTTGNALANAGANAAQGSLTLQGDLASQIATLQNQAQQQKNQLFGRAFDTLGRGMNPRGYGGLTVTP